MTTGTRTPNARRRHGNSHTSLILFIVMISITVGGLVVMTEFQQNAASRPGTIMDTETASARQDDLVIVNVVGQDALGREIGGVRFQVENTGNDRVPLNETVIQIRTDQSVADLRYRNGTLVRDTGSGYYTE